MPSGTAKWHASDLAPVYRITVRGHLGQDWTHWFDGFAIAPQDDGSTCLTGRIVDQAALFGLLKKVQDLGMPVVSVVQHTEER